MPLYHWDNVTVLENYSPGDVVAFGDTVEHARDNARAAFKAFARERWSYIFDPGYEQDEYERAEAQGKLDQFERDIAADPKESLAVCISGSE